MPRESAVLVGLSLIMGGIYGFGEEKMERSRYDTGLKFVLAATIVGTPYAFALNKPAIRPFGFGSAVLISGFVCTSTFYLGNQSGRIMGRCMRILQSGG